VETAGQLTSRQKYTDTYKWLIVASGVAALALSAFWLPMPRFDLRFLLLATVMMLVSSRLTIQIPRANTIITVSDTFIFLVLLLYGGFAGLLMAVVDGLFSGLRVSSGLRLGRKALVVVFN